MFYCNECAEKNNYPISIVKSLGKCECCGKVTECNDMPTSSLGDNKALDSDYIVGISTTPDGVGSHKINVVKNQYMESKEKLIEDIAWQVFLNKSGISFRRELTAEERKSVTDVETYQYYRDEAIKIYDKKQRALSNKKYPIIDIPSDGKSGMWGGAYCLCFVYSKHKGNFVLRGHMREVEAYLEKYYTHYFCNMSLWHRGMDRNIWKFWKDSIGIFTPNRESKTLKGKKKWKFQVRPYSASYDFGDDVDWKEKEKVLDRDSLWFKRMPHQWIPEFDNLKNEN